MSLPETCALNQISTTLFRNKFQFLSVLSFSVNFYFLNKKRKEKKRIISELTFVSGQIKLVGQCSYYSIVTSNFGKTLLFVRVILFIEVNIYFIFYFWCLTPLSAIFQLYHGDQFQWWNKPEYPERNTDHGQATGKLYHLRLRVEL